MELKAKPSGFGRAKEYDAWHKKPFGSYAYKLESELIFRSLGDVKGKKILDLGCGTGNYAIAIAKKGGTATGIDSSEEMILLAKEKAESSGVSAKFLKCSAE